MNSEFRLLTLHLQAATIYVQPRIPSEPDQLLFSDIPEICYMIFVLMKLFLYFKRHHSSKSGRIAMEIIENNYGN